MKRFVTMILAAAVVTACFDDPTSSLRNGPARLQLDRSAITLISGDSVQVSALALDEQGNQLGIGSATWTSGSDATASVALAADQVPGGFESRAWVKAVASSPATTLITVAAQGLSDTVRVTVLPASFAGTAAVLGTVAQDTIFKPTDTGVDTLLYNAGDTLTLSVSGALTFDPAESEIHLGSSNAFIISRSTTQLKALALAPFAGRPVVTNLTYTGPASVGTIAIDSLSLDSIAVRRTEFIMAAAINGADLLDTITVTAPAGTAFTDTSVATFKGNPLFELSHSATTITGIASLAGTGPVIVSNLAVGSAVLPSLNSSANITVGTTPGEANEPANDASAGATSIAGLTAVGSVVNVYGVLNGSTDLRDYYKFTMPVDAAIGVELSFPGDGGGSDDANPDFDVVICTTLSGTGGCSYGQDIIPGNAASSVSQPEAGVTPTVTAGTVVYVRLLPYFGSAAGLAAYRLKIDLQ